MALDRDQFREWCEDLNGGRLKQERGELVCEDPAIDNIKVSPKDSGRDFAAVWDMNSEPYQRGKGEDTHGLVDGTVYREGDTVVIAGNTGFSGSGLGVKVELPESETAIESRGDGPRITTDDLPRADDPWEHWLEENFEMDGHRVVEARY